MIVPRRAWRRRFPALFLLLVTVLPFPQLVAAGTNGGVNRVVQLVQDLDRSADPNAAFVALSTSDRQAVIDFMRVTQFTESSTLAPSRGSPPAGGGAVALATSCWTFTKTLNAKDLLGWTMWSYSQKIDWCGAGGRISGTPARTRWATIYHAYWFFNGHIDSSTSGGNGNTYYQAFTQGSISNCFPFIGCVQNRLPYVDMTVFPNGSVTGSMGG
jgi:hypothetical protein